MSPTQQHSELAAQAQRLRDLHHGQMLVLPNAWDAASARVVADAGFPAVATPSAGISAMLGYPDGQQTPWSELLAANARVARAVDVPVSMDAEGGYGLSPADLVEQLLGAGLVGCNLEDTDHDAGGGLLDAEAHAAWLAEVVAAARAAGVEIVVNARVDVFLPTSGVPDGERLPEAVRRARLYRAAGVDCVYPIGVSDPAAVGTLVAESQGPVNGNTGPDLDLAHLRELGVARVSYGPRFYRTAIAGFKAAVREIAGELA